jgi:glycosyltransferase involved in cell wall biosynthesis
MMKVSIAMATYNGEEYIQEQLQSLVNQSIKPDELVISDDKSTDNTLEIIESFIDEAPFKVKLIVNDKNLGYTGNFNSALMNTTGDVVFLCDQDDVWYPEKIEYMLNLMNGNQDNLLYMNDALLTDSVLNSKKLTKYGQIKSAELGPQAFIMGCCCMVRRELLSLCLPIPRDFKGHDDWIVGIAEGLNKKYIDEEVLQYYRRHETNESAFIPNRLKKITKVDLWFAAFKKLCFNKQRRLEEASAHLVQKGLFLQGLSDIKNSIPQTYEKSFDIYLESKKEELKVLNLRYSLRGNNIFKRFFKAIYFYFFIYDKKTRFQNMLRDMLS